MNTSGETNLLSSGMEGLTEASPEDLSRVLRAVGRCWGSPPTPVPAPGTGGSEEQDNTPPRRSPTPKPHTQTSGHSGPPRIISEGGPRGPAVLMFKVKSS